MRDDLQTKIRAALNECCESILEIDEGAPRTGTVFIKRDDAAAACARALQEQQTERAEILAALRWAFPLAMAWIDHQPNLYPASIANMARAKDFLDQAETSVPRAAIDAMRRMDK